MYYPGWYPGLEGEEIIEDISETNDIIGIWSVNQMEVLSQCQFSYNYG